MPNKLAIHPGIIEQKLAWASGLLAAGLPLYLVRFSIGPIPTTLWEMLLYSTVIIAWVSKIISLKQWRHDSLRWPWLLIAIGACASLFINDDLRLGLGQWKALFLDSLLFYWLLRSIVPKYLSVKHILLATLIGGSVTGLSAVINVLQSNLTTDHRALGIFAFDPGASPNYLALYLAPLASYGLVMVCLPRIWTHRFERIFVGLLIVVIVAGMVASGSRGAALALAAGLVVGLLMVSVKTLHHHRQWLLVAGFISMGLLLSVMISQVTPNFTAVDGGGRLTTSTNIRWLIWQTTVLQILPTHPIFGVGWGNYQSVFYELTKEQTNFPDLVAPMSLHPHNFWLMTWVTLGIIGLIGWLSLVVRITWRSICTNDLLQPALLAGWLTWFVQGLVDTTYYKNDLAGLTIILIVAILGCQVSLPSGQKPSTSFQ